DKLDKIGEEKVKEEMLAKGISELAIEKATPLFNMSGSAKEQLSQLRILLKTSTQGSSGIDDLEEVLTVVTNLGLKTTKLELDVTLARGLNYYTGAIFEVAAPKEENMGSKGGGGRYDDLTGIFGLEDVSGVGISFGLDRIYLVLEELKLFPEAIDRSLDVLCLNFGEKEGVASLKLVTELRNKGVKADIYPTAVKMQKQFKYADKREVPYVILLGEKELTEGTFVVKNMTTGNQDTFKISEVNTFISML
ncbi:MAG: histidine--tRNA ligase, partial [Croceitalea sp.]|nr:histidine--tRNA ligase [Croceitalea sp.]